MATLNISIKKEDLELCKELIETLCAGLIHYVGKDSESLRQVLNSYTKLSKLLKLDDAK